MVCMSVSAHARMCILMRVHMVYVCMYVHTDMCMCLHLHMCAYTCVCAAKRCTKDATSMQTLTSLFKRGQKEINNWYVCVYM